jgi:hypothetical protein
MRSIRQRLVAVAATAGAVAVAAPVSTASAQIVGLGPSQGCAAVPVVGGVGQLGGPGGTVLEQACGAVLAFNGPSIGNISSVIGPTIIGAIVLAPVTASTGGPDIVSLR